MNTEMRNAVLVVVVGYALVLALVFGVFLRSETNPCRAWFDMHGELHPQCVP